MKTWRSARPRAVYARRITKRQFWRLKKAMKADGLVAILTDAGFEWYIGGYKLTTKSICEAWDLTSGQMRRFVEWLYENPWEEETSG